VRTLETNHDRNLFCSGSLAFGLDMSSDRSRDSLMDSEDEAKFLCIAESWVGNIRDRERMRLSKVPRRAKKLCSPENQVCSVCSRPSLDRRRRAHQKVRYACCPASHCPRGKGTVSLIAPATIDALASIRGFRTIRRELTILETCKTRRTRRSKAHTATAA